MKQFILATTAALALFALAACEPTPKPPKASVQPALLV